MFWNRKRAARVLFRALSLTGLFVGLFFIPWALVLIAAVFLGSVFAWYLELLVLGYVASVLVGITAWKGATILGAVLLTEEFLKIHLEPGRWLSYLFVATGGVMILILSSFVIL